MNNTTIKNDTYTENRNHCKAIADDLEKYYNGNVYRCLECGEIITKNDDGVLYCDYCKKEIEPDDADQLSLYDYFTEDIFDIEYSIGGDGEYRGVRLMVACGGPNIYIDTLEKAVMLYWWGERASYPIDYDVIEDIDNIWEENYNCTK